MLVAQPRSDTRQSANQSPAPSSHTREVKLNPKDRLKYVWIPPGTFLMGCSPGDSDCQADEKPAHRVTVSKGFWMGQTPVTVRAYLHFSAATGGGMPPSPEFNSGWADENMPMVIVSWYEAQSYCQWEGGRLPTEAEWEYAARGGNPAARYADLEKIAWYADNSGHQRLDSARILSATPANFPRQLAENGNGTHPVGLKRPNRFGLYDMLGNVWEWVNDWYYANYYETSPLKDPLGPAISELKALRGGSWSNGPRDVRVSSRALGGPRSRGTYYGFRCLGPANLP